MEYSTFTISRPSVGRSRRRKKVLIWTSLAASLVLVLLAANVPSAAGRDLGFSFFGFGKDDADNSAATPDAGAVANGIVKDDAQMNQPQMTPAPAAQGDGTNPPVPGAPAATPVAQPPPGYAPAYPQPGYGYPPPMYPQPMWNPFHTHFMFIPSWLPSMFFHGITSIPHMIGGIFNRGHGGYGGYGGHHETHHHHHYHGHGHGGREPVPVGHRYGPVAKTQEHAKALPLGHTTTSTQSTSTASSHHGGAVPVSAVPVSHHHSSGHHHSHHHSHGHGSRRRH
uniref:Uncharacterized protein n=1 Tax=Lotharella globosa TaxID=91324 RepID=A0A6U3F651_9EUKA|mmetsp:Transcript_22047/g.44242  ORF Transcript_22047/g.44242 Transcript_22047/m.44242 type:complete len:281 (+) Transcript_22047:119-961(+)